MNIRFAELKDMPSIIKLYEGEQMEKLSEFQAKFSPAKVTESITSLIKDHIVLIAEIEGIVIGGMAGIKMPSMFSGDIMFCSMLFYFKEEFRHYTREFVVEAKKIFKDLGFTKITVNALGDDYTLERWYEFLGFKKLETHYYCQV